MASTPEQIELDTTRIAAGGAPASELTEEALEDVVAGQGATRTSLLGPAVNKTLSVSTTAGGTSAGDEHEIEYDLVAAK